MGSSAPIGALRADLMANSAMFAADMARAKGAVQTAAAGMQKAMASFQKGASNAVKEIFNFRNAAVVLAGGALVAFVKRSVQAADEIEDTSQRLGISAESFQELSYAAKIAGVSQEDFTNAMEQFNKRLGDFKGGVTGAQSALGQLGLTMADLKGKTPDQAFKIVADRLAAIPDPMRRAAIESELFGKAGVKLDNVLTLGAAGLAHYAAEARKLGFILSDETIKKAAAANKEFDRISTALKVAGINIAAGFLPALQEVRKVFTSQDFQDSVRSTSAALAEFVKWMVDNKDTIVVVASTLAGIKLGASFGVPGSVVGGLIGLAGGLEAIQSEAKELVKDLEILKSKRAELASGLLLANDPAQIKMFASQIDDYDQHINKVMARLKELKGIAIQPLKITVNPDADPISPEVAKAIDDLIFKARVIKGDFDQLAEGFPEAAKGLKVFGTTADESRVSVASLSPELQRLNAEQLKVKAAQLTQESLPPWEKLRMEVDRARMAFAEAGTSAEVTGRVFARIQFPSMTKAIEDALHLRARLDELGAASLNNLSSALTGIVMGTEKASEAFKKFAISVVTDLTTMIIKATLFSTIASLLGFSGGGKVGLLGFREGGLVGYPTGGFVTGPGTATSDSILARLSDGEFVINAEATRKNLPLLQAINDGDVSARGVDAASMSGERRVIIAVKGLSAREYFRGDVMRHFVANLNDHIRDGGKIILEPT